MRQAVKWIHAGWVVDGTGASPRRHMLLGMQNGSIVSLESTACGTPDPEETYDLSDCLLLPGLIDCHVHLFMSGSSNPSLRESQQHMTFADAAREMEHRLERSLSCGVVAVRDGGDARGHALRYKKEHCDSDAVWVQIKAAGPAWHRKGRYGKFIGRSPGAGETLAESIRGARQDADHVKIINSGINSLSSFGTETPPQFSTEELQQAVSAAHRLARPVMVHANGKKPVEGAILSGCNSIEHGFFMGEENLKRMADSGIFWVPTATPMQAYLRIMTRMLDNDIPGSGFEPNAFRTGMDVARRTLDHQLEQMRKARDLGILLAAGTDAGSLGVHHGSALREEIRLLKTAGYSIAEAVQCATQNNARLLGLDHSGVIAKGMAATVVAVPGGPQDLPDSLERIQAVVVRGIKQ